MIELGRAGSAGYPKGEAPIFRDGAPVALLRASNWKEAATAVVGDRVWVFEKRRGELVGRWATEPAETVRLRARKSSFWKGTWSVDLEGKPVEGEPASMWKGTHRYSSGGRPVAASGSTGGWSPRPTMDADDSVPLHQQVFLLWMELIFSRRNTAAVGATTSAAVIGGST
ncbi:MAG: hypothetical protein JWQ99_1036 [Blastococcus sp.]|jgi:hypothetical protein|nr:hypothetical protein [Blastococcus sp.]